MLNLYTQLQIQTLFPSTIFDMKHIIGRETSYWRTWDCRDPSYHYYSVDFLNICKYPTGWLKVFSKTMIMLSLPFLWRARLLLFSLYLSLSLCPSVSHFPFLFHFHYLNKLNTERKKTMITRYLTCIYCKFSVIHLLESNIYCYPSPQKKKPPHWILYSQFFATLLKKLWT